MSLFEQIIWFRVVVLLLLGLCVGSFLNVVIYRLPLILQRKWQQQAREILEINENVSNDKISLSFPSSHCPKCKNPIPWWTNIPLIGFALLKGKCFACKCSISIRYPIIELFTGIMFVAIGTIFTSVWQIAFACVFVSLMISLMMIDLDTYLLPDEITLPLLWLGLLVSLINLYGISLNDAVIGAAIGYLSLWSIYWAFKLATGKEGMGYGDFKLLAAIGAWFGWQCLVNILLFSSFLGIIYAVILKLSGKLESGKAIPFGPFLGGGGLISLFTISGHLHLL